MKIYNQLFFLLLLSTGLFAQENESNLTQDSIIIADTQYDQAPSKEKGGYFAMFEGGPGRAAFLSSVAPGLGQLYNKRYWKAPIVWAVEGGIAYYVFYYHNLTREFDVGYKSVLRGEDIMFRGLSNAESIKSIRDQYKKFRDYSIVGLVIAHVINIADAFVDRHLIEFDIDDDLSISIPKYGAGIAIIYQLN